MRFVGPRQCNKGNNRNAKERMRSNLQKINVERIAGMQIPIARETGVGGRQFGNVAMTRQCASIWFKTPADPKKPKWLKGLVLLDPPFEVDHAGQKEHGEVMPSMHQACVFHFAPFDLRERDLLDDRSSYRKSLIHYLQHSLNLEARSDFHPLLVVRGVARIVASEWIVTNAHIERDINVIEWQLETMSATVADVNLLQKVLTRLFTHRRRIGKYQALIEEQRDLLVQGDDSSMPDAWLLEGRQLPRDAGQAWRELQSDANQVHDLVTRNAERVGQLVELLMSIMSVREAGLSVKQNETLTFLALVATSALPFNAVAAVLAIQTRFGPEGESFWVFWAASLCTWGLVGSIYLLYPQVRRREVTREV
ncbi:hypothetical protein N657DRAFT_108553 [Parathielavia appendiculata]|uniref:Uncharacterized protein n=1 Tax=Parathielavia appendiculata TaxID=2587402 RepID=A0AAN6Z142_9PEZI|nr:hypothetical protein N657DRAFT_108553 [Parathielavia appendiculata]